MTIGINAAIIYIVCNLLSVLPNHSVHVFPEHLYQTALKLSHKAVKISDTLLREIISFVMAPWPSPYAIGQL